MYLLKTNVHRYLAGTIALIALAGTYLLQEFDYSSWVGQLEGFGKFIFNKSVRFIINDLACLLLIAPVSISKHNVLFPKAWVNRVLFTIATSLL